MWVLPHLMYISCSLSMSVMLESLLRSSSSPTRCSSSPSSNWRDSSDELSESLELLSPLLSLDPP